MHIHNSLSNLLTAATIFSALALLASCDGGRSGGAPSCVPNEVRRCTCSEGRPGRKICQSDHTFGTCRCLEPDAVAPDGWSSRSCPTPSPDDGAIYVAPEGERDAPGTQSAPTTPQAALNGVEAGETIVFLDGEYTLNVAPNTSGTEENPIVLRAATPGAAVVDSNAEYAFDLQNVEHYRIRGFDFGPGSSRWIRLRGAEHVRLSKLGLTDYESTEEPAPLLVENSRHIHLTDSSVANVDSLRTVQIADLSERIVVAGNDFTRTAGWPLRIEQSNHVLVRGNVFHNGTGPNFRIWYAQNVFFDRNVITNGVDGPGVEGAYNLIRGLSSSIRYNRMFRNWGTLLRIEGMSTDDPECPSEREGGFPCKATSHVQIYNNVIDRIVDRGAADGVAFRFSVESSSQPSRDIFNQRLKNNLVTRVGGSSGDAVQMILPDFAGFLRLRGNVFWPGPGATPVVEEGDSQRQVVGNGDGGNDVEWYRSDNRVVEPDVRDLDSHDYRPADGSPLIDAGVRLTRTVEPPTDEQLGNIGRCPSDTNAIFVDQHQYFHSDNTAGRPDFAAVGSGSRTARIATVNFCKTGGESWWQVEIGRELSWDPDDPVGLPWAGSAADVGAWERGAEARPVVGIVRDPYVAETGQLVQLRPVLSDGIDAEQFRWRLGDGNERCGRAVTHRYKKGGDYGIRLTVAAEDGTVYRATDHVLVKGKDVDPTGFDYHRRLVGEHLCEGGAEEDPEGGLRCQGSQ